MTAEKGVAPAMPFSYCCVVSGRPCSIFLTGTVIASLESPDHIAHLVQPGRLSRQKLCCLQRPVSKDCL